MSPGRLAGKVAVITGATSGIGRAIARRFASEGAALVLSGRSQQRADSLLEELHSDGVTADFVIGDIRTDAVIEELARTAEARHGRIDSLVLNAGIIYFGQTWDITSEQFDAMMEINVRAPWLCVRAFHHLLAECATIVAMGSVSSFAIFPGESVYCMSKAAVIQLVRALALELADRRIRVNALCPGVVGGEGMSQVSIDINPDPAAELAHITTATPLGRVAALDEIAAGAAYLASDESSFMTGSSLVLDGGIIIPRVSL